MVRVVIGGYKSESYRVISCLLNFTAGKMRWDYSTNCSRMIKKRRWPLSDGEGEQ